MCFSVFLQIKAMAEKAMQEKEGECRSLQHKLMYAPYHRGFRVYATF